MKIAAIVEARMSSTRLPGKVLLKANNRPMLEHLIDRLKSVKLIDSIIIATTTNKSDDVICDLAKKKKFFIQ
jgi:spore coat polysaccharide biosynthesis protein SpsF